MELVTLILAGFLGADVVGMIITSDEALSWKIGKARTLSRLLPEPTAHRLNEWLRRAEELHVLGHGRPPAITAFFAATAIAAGFDGDRRADFRRFGRLGFILVVQAWNGRFKHNGLGG